MTLAAAVAVGWMAVVSGLSAGPGPGSSAGPWPRAQAASPPLETTVGLATVLEEIVIPGPELEAVPADFASPIVLRVVSASPHGEHFRYDIEVQALEPGEYDLADWLRPRAGDRGGQGATVAALPRLPLLVRSLLAEGRVEPHAREPRQLPAWGGYRAWAIAAGLAWAIGLVALLLAGRRGGARAREADSRPRSLADHLRPLVERAMAGTLTREQRSQLELSLHAFWRSRLGLDAMPVGEALAQLREHPEAGPLLSRLEAWLHAPERADDVDLRALLAPYREVGEEGLGDARPPARLRATGVSGGDRERHG